MLLKIHWENRSFFSKMFIVFSDYSYDVNHLNNAVGGSYIESEW